MQFSLMFFSSDSDASRADRYGLVLRSCRYADEAGFTAVWLPERHFHRFGGLYPSPSVIGAAIAATTRRLRIRAGSVIVPLHDPIRVAEEWSVVDNLSDGRVDLAFGQGWNPNDFVLRPDNFGPRLSRLHDGVEEVRTLWSGARIRRLNGLDATTEVEIFPKPVQQSFGLWITCSGSEQRFEEAGRMGANILTALLFQDARDLERKIDTFRTARARAGYPGRGHVTLMLHTYVGRDPTEVRATVEAPFMRYLEDSTDLWKQNYPQLDALSPDARRAVFKLALEKYVRSHSLCCSVDQGRDRVRGFSAIGVDEIACLVDFGVGEGDLLRSLENVDHLRSAFTDGAESGA
jgi:natural product biosynthesis luciferase-like monooxygenase protein